MTNSAAQIPPPNYDEAAIPAYTLPELLEYARTPVEWMTRRTELLDLLSKHVYGITPTNPVDMHVELLEQSADALDGTAIRKQVRVMIERIGVSRSFDILLYVPKERSAPAPVFLGLNFDGNHTCQLDPEIVMPSSWLPEVGERGSKISRWPAKEIVARGYAMATVYYGDFAPDKPGVFQDGILAMFPEYRGPHAWQAIGAWAWGLSRSLDYLEQDPDLDAKKVVVHGHSRLGKAALWAAAQDTRFAAVVSNNSGCGGAALSRRTYGETVAAINLRFPHWFCPIFQNYNGNEAALPVDQHMLLALAAPRPLYVASAQEDQWADPRGEFLGALHAGPAYELLGYSGLAASDLPALSEPVIGRVSYHIRPGAHDITLYDWERYMDMADQFIR
jgi:hypothetical protein